MNYIKQLEADKLASATRDEIRRTRMDEFRMYLCSSKFFDDTTVQVGDVHRWLDYITADDNGWSIAG